MHEFSQVLPDLTDLAVASRLERIRALGETSKDDSVMPNDTEPLTSRLARHSSDQRHPNVSNGFALKLSKTPPKKRSLHSASPLDHQRSKTGDEFQLEQWHDRSNTPGLRSNSSSISRYPKDFDPLILLGRADDCIRTPFPLKSQCSRASDGRPFGREHIWCPLAHSIAQLSSLQLTSPISPLAPASADAIARLCHHEGPILTNPLLISPVKSRITNNNPRYARRDLHASRLRIREASRNSQAPSSPRIAQPVLNQLHIRTGDNAPFRQRRDFTDSRALRFLGMKDNLLVSPISNSNYPPRVLLALTNSDTVVHLCGYHGFEDSSEFFSRLKVSTSARCLVMNWPPNSLREITTINCTPASTDTMD